MGKKIKENRVSTSIIIFVVILAAATILSLFVITKNNIKSSAPSIQAGEEEATTETVTATSEDIDLFEAAISSIQLDNDQAIELVKEFYPDATTIEYTDNGETIAIPFVELSFNTIGSSSDRVSSARKKGLSNQKISDAASFCYDSLSKKDVKKVRQAELGDKMSIKSGKLKRELYRELLANPPLLKAYAEVVLPKHFGSSKTIGELSPTMKQFIDEYEKALVDGTGNAHWLIHRKSDDSYAMNMSYLKYAATFITLLQDCETSVECLETVDSYHMDGINTPSMTTLVRANYSEDLPSLVFSYRLKNGKIAIKIGSNLLDKRPEILKDPTPEDQETVTKQKETTPKPKTKTETEPKGKTQRDDTNPGGSNEKDTNPTGSNSSKKDPQDDPTNNGNADTGGGSNDTDSAGEKEDDPTVKKSKSDDVDKSQHETKADTDSKKSSGSNSKSSDSDSNQKSGNQSQKEQTTPIETVEKEEGAGDGANGTMDFDIE